MRLVAFLLFTLGQFALAALDGTVVSVTAFSLFLSAALLLAFREPAGASEFE
jgi:hypothetical protein